MTNHDVPIIAVDLLLQISGASGSGPQWAHECEDLDVTLLSWEPGKSIAEHINSEVDVVLIGLTGEGTVTIDGALHQLRSSALILIPKGCQRGMQNGDERWSYLSIHRRRRGLMPIVAGKLIFRK